MLKTQICVTRPHCVKDHKELNPHEWPLYPQGTSSHLDLTVYISQQLKAMIFPVSDYDAAHYYCQTRQVTWCRRDRTAVRLQSQLVLQKKCWATQTAFESSVHRGILTFGQGPSPVTCQYNNVDTSYEDLGLQRLNSQTGTEKFRGLSTHCVTSLLQSQVLMSELGWVI